MAEAGEGSVGMVGVPSHFTDEEAQLREDDELVPRHTGGMWWDQSGALQSPETSLPGCPSVQGLHCID